VPTRLPPPPPTAHRLPRPAPPQGPGTFLGGSDPLYSADKGAQLTVCSGASSALALLDSTSAPAGCLSILQQVHGLDEVARDAKSQCKKRE
jgi:hypothetical protein